MRPTGFAAPARSISSRFGKCSSAPVSTTPPETALTRIARRQLDAEVADERLERRLRGSDEDVVLEHALRAERRDARRSTSRRASAARRRAPAASKRARIRVERPVPVLVLGLERGADRRRSRRCGRARRAARARRPRRARAREVTLPRTSTGSTPSARSSVAVSSAAGRCGGSRSRRASAPSRAKRSAIARPIPREPPVTKTFTRRRGSGRVGAARRDGISSQPECASATRAAPPRPSTTRGRAGRAARSAARA